MTRICAIVDSIHCQASSEGLVTGRVVTCWACGEDVCRSCSAIVAYRWKGQRRRVRFCVSCQEQRGVWSGVKEQTL